MSSAQEVLFIRLCIQFSSITLVFYDYALTWTREVRYFWMRNRQQTMGTRKFQFRFPFISLSTALYIACRYAMISNVLYAVALSGGLKSLGGVSCDTGYQICASFSVIGRAAIIAVWGIRTYAMFNRHILILILFGGMGSLIVTMDAVHVKYVVCGGGRGSQIAESLLAIFMVVYEVLVAMFTSVRAWQAMRVWKEIGGYSSIYGSGSGSAGEASNKGKGKAKRDDDESEEEERMEEERREMKRMRKYDLEWLCVKQGILYFCFVSMFTLGALITLNIAPNGSFIQRLLNAFTLPISGIMTSRFLLHLRQWEHRATHSSVTDGADEDDEDDIEFNASSNSGSRVRGGPLKFATPSRQSLDSDLEVNDLGSKHGHYKYSEYDEDEDDDDDDLHKPTHPASEPSPKPERPKRSRSWSDSIIEEFGCDPVGRAVSVRERRGSRNGNDKGKGKCVAVDIDVDLERNNSEVNEDDR